MDKLIQSLKEKSSDECTSLGQRLSREAFTGMAQFPPGKALDTVQKGILPELSIESNEPNFKYEGIDTERKALLELAEKHIKDPEILAKFKADMERFETRGRKDGLSTHEIQETYTNLSRLLKAGPDARVNEPDRAAIAHQIMRQAANPMSIDQGHHYTCNVTTIEANLYSKEPSRVAALIADVVTTGKYQGALGKAVSVPDSTFQPDSEARKAITVDGERSFASQLFQVTAINLFYANHDGYMRYEQFPVTSADGRDTGERLRPLGVIPFWKNSDGPELSTTDMAITHELIVGRKDPMLILRHSSYAPSHHESVRNFGSKDQFVRTLDEAQRLGKFPLIMMVDTRNPPFNHESGGCHVVNIRDYNATTGEVMLDNQWGTKNDIRIKIEDLYRASMTPYDRAVAEVNAENQNANAHLKVLKLLEHFMERGKLVKPEELLIALEKASKEWKPGDKTADQDYQKTLDKLFRSMLFTTQLEFLGQMSLKPVDSSFMGQCLDRLFAQTAYVVGFDQKSLSNPGPQTKEYGRKIVSIWLDMPAQRQQRILAEMAAKHS